MVCITFWGVLKWVRCFICDLNDKDCGHVLDKWTGHKENVAFSESPRCPFAKAGKYVHITLKPPS